MSPSSLSLIRSCFPGSGYALPDESVETCLRGEAISHVGVFWRNIDTSRGTLDVGGIGLVCTHPNWRRLGLATALLDVAFRRVQLHNITRCALYAGRAEAEFYLPHGFKPTNVEHLYISGPDVGQVFGVPALW